MNAVEKAFTSIGIVGTVVIAAAGTELATLYLTDTINPINLRTYLQFQSIVDDIEDRSDRNFLAVKEFVTSHSTICTLTATQFKPLIGQPIDEFRFYKSWSEVPLQIKQDPTRLTDWEAVKRFVTIKKREITERKAREQSRTQQQLKNNK